MNKQGVNRSIANYFKANWPLARIKVNDNQVFNIRTINGRIRKLWAQISFNLFWTIQNNIIGHRIIKSHYLEFRTIDFLGECFHSLIFRLAGTAGHGLNQSGLISAGQTSGRARGPFRPN